MMRQTLCCCIVWLLTTGSSSSSFNANGSVNYSESIISQKFQDLMISGIDACYNGSVVVLHGDQVLKQEILKDFVNKINRKFIFYDVKTWNRTETKKNLLDLYAHREQIFFFLALKNPYDLMEMAEEVFNEKNRSLTAIMPHKSQWLVWVWNSAQEELLAQQQQFSAMDNVGVIRLHMDLNLRVRSYAVYTFVWTTEREKKIRDINISSLMPGDKKECIIFPNKKYGLNKRHLTVFGPLYMSKDYLDGVKDKNGVITNVTGFRAEVLKVLSESLNFTYNMTVFTEPDKEILTAMQNRDADFAVSVWATTAIYDQIDVTYPIHFDGIRGLYVSPPKRLTLDCMSTFLLLPFPIETLVFLLVTLLGTAVLWMIVATVRLEYQNYSNQFSNIFPESKNGDKSSDRSPDYSCILLFFSLTWALSRAIINQASMPRTNSISTRLIIWTWCLSMMLYYAIHTGSLTSQMVQPSANASFKTFEEMLSNGNFEWGTLRDGGKILQIFNSSQNKILKRLGEDMIILNDRLEIEVGRELLLDTLKDRFVFIYYESFISNLLKEGHFILMDEVLINMNRGLSVPKGSELRDLLGSSILRLHEAGILDRLRKEFDLSLSSARTCDESSVDQKKTQPITIADILSLLCLITLLLVSCTLILVVEIIINKRDLPVEACL